MDERVEARAENRASGARTPRRLAGRRVVRWAVVALVAAAVVVVAWRYWRHTQLYASTDDAYLNANVVQIAAQVSGQVVRVDVIDQQHVKAGQLLFEVDPRPFEYALQQAQAQLQLARQTVAEKTAAVVAARAQVALQQAQVQNAEVNNRRTTRLAKNGFYSVQAALNTSTEARTAAAAMRAAQAQLAQAESALGEPGDSNAAIRAAVAELDEARYDLQRTRVTAPTSGTVANLTLRPGAPVQTNVPVFAIVSDAQFWVDCNFKETELYRIRPGERATVRVDMYPGHPFRGEVQSVSGGSGAAFSLLPPENATGNWVKVTQRVPVRVRILDSDPERPLSIGTSAEVEVRVR